MIALSLDMSRDQKLEVRCNPKDADMVRRAYANSGVSVVVTPKCKPGEWISRIVEVPK